MKTAVMLRTGAIVVAAATAGALMAVEGTQSSAGTWAASGPETATEAPPDGSTALTSTLAFSANVAQRTDLDRWRPLSLTGGGSRKVYSYKVRSSDRLTVTFSGIVAGDRAQLRVFDKAGVKGTRVLAPGNVSFGPGPASFTFVSAGDRSDDCRRLELQWRSPSGEQVELSKFTTVIHFKDSGRMQPLTCR